MPHIDKSYLLNSPDI